MFKKALQWVRKMLYLKKSKGKNFSKEEAIGMRAETAANYLVYLMADSCDDLTNMKLNKLLYYAQGHYLQKYNKPMFSDKIEAWEHGPVVPTVYSLYKSYADQPITKYNEKEAKAVSEDTADVLFEVARKYGKYTASTLRNMTHALNTPWDKVYKPGENYVEIPLQTMSDFFSSLDELKPLKCEYKESDFIGRRDKDGYLVLPEGWD